MLDRSASGILAVHAPFTSSCHSDEDCEKFTEGLGFACILPCRFQITASRDRRLFLGEIGLCPRRRVQTNDLAHILHPSSPSASTRYESRRYCCPSASESPLACFLARSF